MCSSHRRIAACNPEQHVPTLLSIMNVLHSTLSTLRDRWAPISHTSTFRTTGQITPEEFVLAGDYIVYKFPTWSWADASHAYKRVTYLPAGKQFLVTRGVPCHRRLDENFAGDAGHDEAMVQDGFASGGGEAGGDDDGWLRTGQLAASQEARMRDVRTVDESGEVGEREEEEEIPDMEDDEDDEEAIIRDPKGKGINALVSSFYNYFISFFPFWHLHFGQLSIQNDTSRQLTTFQCYRPLRTYTLYITYTPYYRTPRLYLSGYLSPSEPLPPHLMMEDIVGDYADKTVTLEDFPFFEHGVKMASVHPCKHAPVMKALLDRADAALKLRKSKSKTAPATSAADQLNRKNTRKVETGMEGLIDDLRATHLSSNSSPSSRGLAAGVAAAGGSGGDEWEVLQHEGGEGGEEEDAAIRVDQYLVVFLKFMASVTPGIEHDFTMGV